MAFKLETSCVVYGDGIELIPVSNGFTGLKIKAKWSPDLWQTLLKNPSSSGHFLSAHYDLLLAFSWTWVHNIIFGILFFRVAMHQMHPSLTAAGLFVKKRKFIATSKH